MLANLSKVNGKNSWVWFTSVPFFLLLFFLINSLSSADLSSSGKITPIAYLQDTNNQLDINSIQKIPNQKWQALQHNVVNMGLKDEVVWLSFTLPNASSEQARLLQIDSPFLDHLSLWFVNNADILTQFHLGDALVFSQRPINHKSFLFPVPELVPQPKVYVRVQSAGALNLPIKIWNQSNFVAVNSRNELTFGVFLGLILAMGLCFLFFFVTSKNTAFLIFSGYVTSLGLTLLTLSGLGYQYLWPNFPWLQQHALGIAASLSLGLAVIFCQRLLQVNTHNPRLDKMLSVSTYLVGIGLFLSLIIPLSIFIYGFVLILCVVGLLKLGAAIWLWYKGLDVAVLFSFSWAILFICSLMVCLNSLSMIQVDIADHSLLMVGVTIETMMLALILAINHNKQRQALLATQAELLEKQKQAQTAQKEMLALQENATEDLEYKVQERTLELEIALRELSEINRELEQKNTLDALTGIRNRRYFDKKYQAEVRRSRREQTELSIVMIDIDHFKKVNDEHGHLVGDECIKSVAAILKKALKRPSDDVFRYGGEEFALILPHTDLDGALALVEQLREEIQNTTIQAEDVSIHITISAGIGSAVAELNQPEDAILALADKQLYIAKDAGRNHVTGRHLDVVHDQE